MAKTIETKYQKYQVSNETEEVVECECKSECMKCMNCEFGYVNYRIITGGIFDV